MFKYNLIQKRIMGIFGTKTKTAVLEKATKHELQEDHIIDEEFKELRHIILEDSTRLRKVMRDYKQAIAIGKMDLAITDLTSELHFLDNKEHQLVKLSKKIDAVLRHELKEIQKEFSQVKHEASVSDAVKKSIASGLKEELLELHEFQEFEQRLKSFKSDYKHLRNAIIKLKETKDVAYTKTIDEYIQIIWRFFQKTNKLLLICVEEEQRTERIKKMLYETLKQYN